MGRGLRSLLTSAQVRAWLGGRGELVSAPRDSPHPRAPRSLGVMLGHDLLGHGASNPNLCLGAQVGVHLTPQGLKTTFSSSLHRHTLSRLAVGGIVLCWTHGRRGPQWTLWDGSPVTRLTKLGPREAGAQTLVEELWGQERQPWPPSARLVTGKATGSTGGHTAGSSHHWAEVPLSLPPGDGRGEDRHRSSDGETETQVGLLTEEPRLTSPSHPSAPPAAPRPAPRAALPSL